MTPDMCAGLYNAVISGSILHVIIPVSYLVGLMSGVALTWLLYCLHGQKASAMCAEMERDDDHRP